MPDVPKTKTKNAKMHKTNRGINHSEPREASYPKQTVIWSATVAERPSMQDKLAAPKKNNEPVAGLLELANGGEHRVEACVSGPLRAVHEEIEPVRRLQKTIDRPRQDDHHH